MRDRYIRDVVGAFLEASDGVSSGHRAFANAASMAGLDLGQLGEESLPERLLEQRMRSSNKQIDRKTLDFARRRRLLTQEGADIREANLRAKFVPTGKVRVVGTRIDAIRGVGGPGPRCHVDDGQPPAIDARRSRLSPESFRSHCSRA